MGGLVAVAGLSLEEVQIRTQKLSKLLVKESNSHPRPPSWAGMWWREELME